MPLPPISKEDLDHIVSHCEGLLPDLEKANLFITGGTGFFGMWLVEGLLAINRAGGGEQGLGMNLTVLSRNPATFCEKVPHLANDPALTLISGDVKTFDFLPGWRSRRFDSIIHCATETMVTKDVQSALARLDTILLGTRRILDLGLYTGARRLLNVSSGAVYGRQPPEISHIPESYLGGLNPLLTGSTYGECKRVAEHLGALYAEAAAGALSIPIARGFAFHGPHLPLDAHFAAGNFLRDVLKGETVVIQGDGTPRRSYLYGADLVVWLLHILFKGRSGAAYNLGSDTDLSITQVAQETAKALEYKGAVQVLGTPVPGRLPERYVPDISLAREELGMDVWIPFPEQVKRTARWQRHK